MTSSHEIESIFRDAFEDVALLIGGVTTLHHLDDDVVRTLIRRLDRVRSRALVRLMRAGGHVGGELLPERPCGLHPAIEVFLQRNACGHAPALNESPQPTNPRASSPPANELSLAEQLRGGSPQSAPKAITGGGAR